MVKFDFVKGGGSATPIPVSKQLARIVDVDEVKSALAEHTQKLADLLDEINLFEIKTDKDMDTVSEMLGQSKNLKKDIIAQSEIYYKPFYNHYKQLKGLENSLTAIPDQIIEVGQNKLDRYGYIKEMERRKAEAAAQKKIDDMNKKLAAEAKKTKTKAVKIKEKPVVPATGTRSKTQTATAKVKMVWAAEIEDLASTDLFDWVLKLSKDDYQKLADRTKKKMLRAGIREGVKGVRFYETAKTIHRAK